MSGAGTGISGGGTGLMSGGGLSMGSGGPGNDGFEGCSIMKPECAITLPEHCSVYTSSPTARISASALLCSTTPGLIR
jgi:hypothetical protein